eukprot:7701938-Alexandrium_andersonii.AAC.1
MTPRKVETAATPFLRRRSRKRSPRLLRFPCPKDPTAAPAHGSPVEESNLPRVAFRSTPTT